MRFVTLKTAVGPRPGIVLGDRVMLLDGYQSLQALIEAGDAGLDTIKAALPDYQSRAGIQLNMDQLLAPLPRPLKNVFCVGLNYAAHARESLQAKGLEVKMPEHPVFSPNHQPPSTAQLAKL